MHRYKSEEEVIEETDQEDEAEDTEENAEGDDAKPDEAVEDEENPPNCNQTLLNSVGLLGVTHSEEMKMDICTSVTDSCCQLEDQLAIFDHFKNSQDLENLNERFNYHKKVICNNKRFTMNLLKNSKELSQWHIKYLQSRKIILHQIVELLLKDFSVLNQMKLFQ
jgi:hypothetical protein